MAKFSVGHSTVRVWKGRRHWSVTVDGAPVGGRHMTEAQAAGAGLLWALGVREVSVPLIRRPRREASAGQEPRQQLDESTATLRR